MMKRIVPFLLGFMVCSSLSLADYSDGFITAGEYEYGVRLFNHDVLIVEGGGADIIEARDFSYLEVRYTSTPLSNSGGIWDIVLGGDSELLYLDGETEEITIGSNAEAVLKGGRIDYITNMQYVDELKNISIYCQPGWSWLLDGNMEKIGINGLWEDNTSFAINFINDVDYDPVWMNINVVPEPASFLLLGLGLVMFRRKR